MASAAARGAKRGPFKSRKLELINQGVSQADERIFSLEIELKILRTQPEIPGVDPSQQIESYEAQLEAEQHKLKTLLEEREGLGAE